MKIFYKTCAYPLFFLAALLISCDKSADAPAEGTLTIDFQHVVDSAPLELHTGTYTTPAGDSYQVSKLKYYISHVKLLNEENQEVYLEPDSYHLIEAGGKTSFVLKGVPAKSISGLKFSIGVDSVMNHTIDHTGDLDPSNEMVWTWDTGYKFFLLEGTYTGDTGKGGIVFHVGSDALYKTISLRLPKPFDLRQHPAALLTIEADLNEFFRAPNLLDLDEMSSAMMGPGAEKVAENYSTNLFRVSSIK